MIVTLDEGPKLDPDTITVTPTIPLVGFKVTIGTSTVSVAVPVREPVPTLPVTVRVKLPPGVEPDVAMVSNVTVGVDGVEGNGTGLVSVTVLLDGAPVSESRIVLGRPTVVEPEDSEMVTL